MRLIDLDKKRVGTVFNRHQSVARRAGRNATNVLPASLLKSARQRQVFRSGTAQRDDFADPRLDPSIDEAIGEREFSLGHDGSPGRHDRG